MNFLGCKNIPMTTPMTVAGVGGGKPTRWLYAEYGDFLNAYNINSGFSCTFNLKSKSDIESKLGYLKEKVDWHLINMDIDDVSELEERLRTANSLTSYGREISDAALEECKPTTSQKQIDHLREIQPLTHTDEANQKRRKTIATKRDRKLLGL